MNKFNWERGFSNLNINEMVSVCHTTIKNIMANFIPHETINCDDRDPPWINNRIKKIIYERNSLYKDYRKNNDTQIFEKLTLLQKKLHLAMEELKNSYLLSITYEIYHSMDEGYEIRGVFLDISKAFDMVWHEGLLLKIKAEWDI